MKLNERALKLTHKEIQTIENALNYVFNTKLQQIDNCSTIITDDEKSEMLFTANKYGDLADAISNSEKDQWNIYY